MELDEINHTIGRRIKGIDYIYIYMVDYFIADEGGNDPVYVQGRNEGEEEEE